MSAKGRVATAVRRLLGRHSPDPHGGDSYYYQDVRKDGAGVDADRRWADIALVIDLRATDAVLDLGCAEGLVALQAARRAATVQGMEVLEHRVKVAREHAQRAGVLNVTFVQGSIIDDDLPSRAFDVTLFLGLYGYPAGATRIGEAELAKALQATRRQIVLRVDVQDDPVGLTYLPAIYACFHAHGFDGLCFPKVSPRHGNIILGNRQGAGARLPYLPPIMLAPSDLLAAAPGVQDSVTADTVRDPMKWVHVLDDDMLARTR